MIRSPLIATHRQGFTILELIVVIAGIAALAAIGMPSALIYLKYLDIEKAKVVLNETAAQCLQRIRTDPGSFATHKPNLSSLPKSYMTATRMDTCQQITITARDSNSNPAPMLSFAIDPIAKKVYKIGQVNTRDTTREHAGACQSWGTCTTGSFSSEVANLLECRRREFDCRSKLEEAVQRATQDGPLAQKGWQPTDQGCNGNATNNAQCTCSKSMFAINNTAMSENEYGANACRESTKNVLTTKGMGLVEITPAEATGCSGSSYWLRKVQIDYCTYHYENWRQTADTRATYPDQGLIDMMNNQDTCKCCRPKTTAIKCSQNVIIENTMSESSCQQLSPTS
jgi:Tfp pilus assembly protein PilE